MQPAARKFYTSLVLLVLLNAVIKPAWIFGIDRQVQNSVGTFQYGSYFSLYNLSIVLNFLLDWGLTTYFNRQLASREENFIARAGSFLLMKSVFAILYAAIVVMVAYLTGVTRWDIVAGVILIQVLASLFLFFRAIITAEQWFTTDAWLSVLDKTLMILFCGSLLYFPILFGNITINRFLWVQVTCTGLAMLTSWWILLRRNVSFTPGAYLNRQLFRSAFPYAVVALLMAIHYRIDGFLLERIHPDGAHQAGVYAAAYRLLDASVMVSIIFVSFLLPYIARQWSERKDITSVVLQARHFLLILATGITCTAVFLAPWIQQLLYTHHDKDSIPVLQWCLPALIGYTLSLIYGTVMTATGHIRPYCIIMFIAILLNIMINLFLIPSLGAKGCCIAALASQTFAGLATLLYTHLKLEMRVEARSLLIYILTAAVLAGIYYGGMAAGITEPVLITAAIFITLLIMVATRLLQPAKWKMLLTK